ncbi:MAG: hypothetical protein AB7S38_11170 [Vulcanimicrobiota bacterium]
MQYRLNQSELRRWKAREGRTFVWLANKIGVTKDTFYQQMGGVIGVSVGVLMRLSKVTGIPVETLVVATEQEAASA